MEWGGVDDERGGGQVICSYRPQGNDNTPSDGEISSCRGQVARRTLIGRGHWKDGSIENQEVEGLAVVATLYSS